VPGTPNVASDFLANFGATIGEFFVDALALIGLGLGGGQAAAAPWLADLEQTAFSLDPSKALSPAEVASALVKNQITEGDAIAEAALSGVNGSRLQMLRNLTGNPPGPETLLQMQRRGIISGDDVHQGLREGYLRDEWAGQVMALVDVLLDPHEAVDAAVQGHMDYGAAQALAGLSGIGPGSFDVLYQTAGNPPGPMETLTMLNRGIIDEPTAVQALRESRLKDKYIPQLLALARRRLPLRSVTQLLNAGAITDQQATENLRALGYDAADAAAIIAGHRNGTAATVRHLTVVQVKELLDAGMITQGEAVHDLTTLGYTAADAGSVVSLMVVPPERKTRALAVTRIRARYDAHRITRTEASNALDALQVDATQRDELLSVWDIEAAASTAELTVAELTRAARIGAITVNDCAARLAARGYSDADVTTMLYVHQVVPVPGGGGA
jgi:hypothetical protein